MPEPGRGPVAGGGSPPPHEASTSAAAAPPSASRRVTYGAMRPQTSLRTVRISRADHDAADRSRARRRAQRVLRLPVGARTARSRASSAPRTRASRPTATSSTTRACSPRTSSTTTATRSGSTTRTRSSPAEPSQTDINLATLSALALPDRVAGGRAGACGRGGSPTGRSRRRSSTSSTADQRLACPACGREDESGASFCPSCGMPLVRPGAEPLEAPLSEAHGRARKIDPAFTEGELVRVAGGRNQTEAEFIQALLLEWGVPSVLRRTRGLRRARLPRGRAARHPRARVRRRDRARGAARRRTSPRPRAARPHGPAPARARGGDRLRRRGWPPCSPGSLAGLE